MGLCVISDDNGAGQISRPFGLNISGDYFGDMIFRLNSITASPSTGRDHGPRRPSMSETTAGTEAIEQGDGAVACTPKEIR